MSAGKQRKFGKNNQYFTH